MSSASFALSAGAYLRGLVELAIAAGAIAYGAVELRRLLLPGWTGAPARLVEVVLWSAGMLLVSELIGTFGHFQRGWFLAVSILGGVGAGLLARSRARAANPSPSASPPAPPAAAIAKILALVIVTGLTAAWVIPTLGSIAAGMDRADTMWYHLPLAARFVQTGHLGSIFFFDPVFFASFYPANSEVFHSIGMLFFGRDILSPFVNDGWLIVALLSCYCIGRPYGAGPQALIGGSVALGAQMLVEFQAGEGLNDITGVAFFLAAAAILANAYATRKKALTPEGRPASGVGSEPGAPGIPPEGRSRIHASHRPRVHAADVLRAPHPPLPAVVMAGLAAGLAAGVKLSFLPIVAAMTVGVVWMAGKGRRRRAALAWSIPMLVGGSYWYLRNLFAVGNPIPEIHHLGPIAMPAPIRDFSLRPGFSVFHYATDTRVWSDWFAPGLHDSLGLLWPVTVIGIFAISAYALWRGRDPILRLLGRVAGFAAVVYIFTPFTAAGVEGEPIGFIWNLRYLAPSVALAFALLPCLPAFVGTPARRARALLAVFVLAGFTIGSLVQWQQGHLKGALAAAAVVAVGGMVIAAAGLRGIRWDAIRPSRWAAALVLIAAVAVAGGYEVQKRYMQHRYEDAGSVPDLAGAFAWVRGVHDSRIALAGVRGIFTQYAFYGPDLSNDVQWLGHQTAHDGYARIASCDAWYRAVNEGRYRYVVATHDPYDPGTLTTTPESRWTGADPNARLVLTEGPLHIFEVQGPLDPSNCTGQHRLSQHQLHGVPDPTNPQ